MILTLFAALLALYVACNLGANDVANSMGTSVGSKALSLRQAIVVAGILEFSGAVLFGSDVARTLSSDIVEPELFASAPQVLLVGMISVSIACGLWLQAATSRGWPVASSHAVVGAIAGFTWVAIGLRAVEWGRLGIISATWILTPLVSGAIAAAVYRIIDGQILRHGRPLVQLGEWIPWLSALLAGTFGAIVLPVLTRRGAFDFAARWGLPDRDIPLAIGAGAAVAISVTAWRQLSQFKIQNSKFKIEETEGNFSPTEAVFARFQVLSACFVAFAHGSNDVGNAIAPLAAIADINRTGAVPTDDFAVPIWILAIGGAGIVIGLALWGRRVIATIGEKIIALQPSSGFCAELATAATVLLASRAGLPVSTSHALVGGVVGVALVQQQIANRSKLNRVDQKNNPKSKIQNPKSNDAPLGWSVVRGIALAWLVTLPAAAALAATIFTVARNWI